MNHFGQQKKEMESDLLPHPQITCVLLLLPPTDTRTHSKPHNLIKYISETAVVFVLRNSLSISTLKQNFFLFFFFNKNRPPKLSNRHNQWKPIATFLYTPNSLSANSSLIQQQKPIPSHPQPPVK